VKQSPLPAYFESFLSKHLRKSGSESQGSNSADFITKDELGKIVYEAQSKPRPELQILQKTFQTGIYDGNSVGNLYYSNYYDWQAKSIEYLVHKIDPEIFPANGRAGEFISLRSNVNHLQEAMPFEEIEVNMYLEKRYENGVKLYFEYFSLNDGGKRKLAYGNNTVIWASRKDEKSQPIAHALPHKIENFLKELDKRNSLLPRQDVVN
jgi:acyl-CoA thioesterase FadM